MSLPANMFFDNPEVQDVAKEMLSNNVEEWSEQIVQKLKERIPSSDGLSMIVKMQRKDEENGVAVGAVLISSANKSAYVPLVIKDFMLYPLDIFIAEKKLLPLTPQYFDTVFSDNDLFTRLEEFPSYGGLGRFEEANLWNAMYPPALGRYAYASGKDFPMLNSIADTMSKEDVKHFVDTVKGDMKIAGMFAHHDRGELVKKLASVNNAEFAPSASDLLPKRIAVLRYESPNKYNLLSSHDKVFSPALTVLTREDACNFVSEISDDVDNVMNDVDQNGEKILTLPSDHGDHVLAVADQGGEPVPVKEFGHYKVTTGTGLTETGVVIPNVVNFDMVRTPLKIFLGKTFSTIQDTICGVDVGKCDFWPLKGCSIRVGQTGTFVYTPDKSHGVATVPVTVRSITQDGPDYRIRAVDLDGGIMFNIRVSPADNKLKRIAKVGDEYILPYGMVWVPMEGFYPISESVTDYALKTAAARDAYPVTVISTGYDTYAMKGVQKYASAAKFLDAGNLDRASTKFLLASLGLGEAKIASVLKQANDRGAVRLDNVRHLPTVAEKTAKARPLADYIRKKVAALKADLIKEASYMENAQTVDALLSLNFVNPDNIAKFVGKLPLFKSAISQLASALLASRLGMQEIPEQATASAMEKMVEVVAGLEKLRAGSEMGVK